MTAEEKRERLLKRILPGLAITVIYFVFISGLLSDKMVAAEKEYEDMVRSGVSEGAMSGVLAQQRQTRQQITKLQKENKKYADQLKELAGFLSADGSSNTTATRLSQILAKNGIKTQKEERESIKEEDLGPALKEVWQWLKPSEKNSKKAVGKKQAQPSIHVQHLWLKGSYPQVFKALSMIAKSDLQVLPVALTMRMPESGGLEWELILWM